jgi:hypothetical protein
MVMPLRDRAAAAFFRALAARDDTEAAALAEIAATAAVAAMRESWGLRLAAGMTLLEAAEQALDRAETALDPEERRRELALFELLIASASAD